MKGTHADLLGLAGTFLLTASVLAHHGGTTLYDLQKEVTLKGATITGPVWANPHVEIEFDATDDKGVKGHWILENNSPPVLVTRGWTRTSLHSGDIVTITFNPGREVPHVGRLVKLVMADGKELR